MAIFNFSLGFLATVAAYLCPCKPINRTSMKTPRTQTIQMPFVHFQFRSGGITFQAEDGEATVELEPAAFLEAFSEAADVTPYLIAHFGGEAAVKTFFKCLLAEPDLMTEMLGLILEADGPADFIEAREIAFAEIIKTRPKRALDAIPDESIAAYLKNIVLP